MSITVNRVITFEVPNWKTEKTKCLSPFEISLLKYIMQFRIFEKSIGKLNFVIKDVHITQKMDCVILLRFLHLACFTVSTCVISI